MSAARLDPFSARLHAIHRKGAKAKPPKPALQEESAPEVATGMHGSMSYVPAEDEGRGSMSYVPVNDEGQGSMSLSAMDEELSVYGSEGPDDDDGAPRGYQAQIHELRRRLSALESEVVELKARLGGA